MEGVNILSEKIIYQVDVWWPAFFITAFTVMLICLLIGGFYDYKHTKKFDVTCCCEGAIIGIVVGICVGFAGILPLTAHETDQIDYKIYTITVSDDVNFNEFQEKYEIIEQEGSIYTVKERIYHEDMD